MRKNISPIESIARRIAEGDVTRSKTAEAGEAAVARVRDMSRVQRYTMAGVAALGVTAMTAGVAAGAAGGGEETSPVAAQKQSAQKESAPEQTKGEAKAEADVKADRSGETGQAAARSTGARGFDNNLDGWIRQSLKIMKEEGIPGSYEGLHRNIIRESSGDPKSINDWDINAVNGVPSKGLLQVIPPTFDAYHVEGTSKDIYDPVANITAAANYAADKYGTMDNVDSAY